MEKEVEDSFFKLFRQAYGKCKESLNLYFLGLSYIFSYISSALEAISLGLAAPLLERVIYEKEKSDIGVIQSAIDYLNLTETNKIIAAVALMIFGAIVLKNIFAYSSGWLSRIVTNNVNHALRTKMMNEYLHRNYLFFERNKIGDLSYTLNLSGAFVTVLTRIQTMLKAAFFCISYALMLVYLSPKISIFIVFAFLPLYFIARSLREMLYSLSKKTVEIASRFNSKTFEMLSSVRLIKSYASEDKEQKKYSDLSKESKDLAIKLGNRSSLVGVLEEPVMVLGVMALAGIAFFFFLDDTKGGIAGFMTFFVILRRFEFQLKGLVTQFTTFIQLKPKLKKSLSAFDTKNWMTVKSGNAKFRGLVKGITFKDVNFRYTEHGDYVLHNINLSIKKGKITALVGESGSGKSTMAMLIPRLFDSYEGKILVDDLDIKKYDLMSLRKNIGIVSQNVEILNRSVRDNLCFGIDYRLNDKDLISIAKKARIYEFVKNMPNGFDTLLGERGMDLSGGQRQRVSIARALIKNPDILILDEATSALDTETEKEIQEVIEEALKGRTVIAIAHRLSTIRNADTIIVLEDGKIIEQGGFDELLKKKGRFYHYWQMQSS